MGGIKAQSDHGLECYTGVETIGPGMASLSGQINRREYFRVQDTVALQFEAVSGKFSEGDPLSLLPDDFQSLHELQKLAREARQLIRQIGDQNRLLADYLRLQESRFDLLTRAFISSAPALEHMPRREVTLSEGGIEFQDPRGLLPEQTILMRLMLFPDQHTLAVFGRVVHVESGNPPGSFTLGVEFLRMTDSDQQILARHALHLQSEARRERGSAL